MEIRFLRRTKGSEVQYKAYFVFDDQPFHPPTTKCQSTQRKKFSQRVLKWLRPGSIREPKRVKSIKFPHESPREELLGMVGLVKRNPGAMIYMLAGCGPVSESEEVSG
jgi:hypothetical protein